VGVIEIILQQLFIFVLVASPQFNPGIGNPIVGTGGIVGVIATVLVGKITKIDEIIERYTIKRYIDFIVA
jgi:hypothetical protein